MYSYWWAFLVLLVHASATCGGDDCTTLEVDADQGALLQSSKPRLKKAERTAVLDALANVNLLDLEVAAKGGSITQNSWNRAFKGLDSDGDGVVSMGDLLTREGAHARGEDNLARRFNLTKKDIRAGIALACTWFPEEAGRMVTNEALLTELIFNGTKMPADASVPENPLSGLVVKKIPKPALTQVSTLSDTCVLAVIQLTVGVFNLLFGMLGLEGPSGSTVSGLIGANAGLLNSLMIMGQKLAEAKEPFKAAYVVKDIFQVLYDEGIFSQALQATLDQLDWWDYTMMTIEVAAILTAWLGTGGAAFVAQLALLVMGAVDLWDGVSALQKSCF